MDLTKLGAFMPQVTKMELIHPVSGKMNMFLHIVGEDSKGFRDLSKRLLKDRLANSKDGKANIDVDQIEKDNIALSAVCIIGWDTELENAFGVYTPERAVELMGIPELAWMKEQVEAFKGERSNFFPKSNPAA